jgi:hypothetical protein
MQFPQDVELEIERSGMERRESLHGIKSISLRQQMMSFIIILHHYSFVRERKWKGTRENAMIRHNTIHNIL